MGSRKGHALQDLQLAEDRTTLNRCVCTKVLLNLEKQNEEWLPMNRRDILFQAGEVLFGKRSDPRCSP